MKHCSIYFSITVLFMLIVGSGCKSSSNESIRALVVINQGLLDQKLITEKSNDNLMAMFASQAVTNPHYQRFSDLQAQATTVAKKAHGLNEYIEDLKIQMVVMADGVKPEE